eukprot:COSAG02_NODE_54_length_43941_cov_54.857990_47_plen_54_part_00
MPLPESYKKLGMKPICPNAGDMMVMPEVRILSMINASVPCRATFSIQLPQAVI